MSTIHMRLNGSAEAIDAMLNVLRESDGVDRVEEMGAAEAPRVSDDSSSAGLSGATATGARDVEVHAISEATLRNVRDRADMASRDAGVVVEWLEPF